MKNIFTYLLLIALTGTTYAQKIGQERVDSLVTVLNTKHTAADTNRLNTLIKTASACIEVSDYLPARNHAIMALQLARNLLHNAGKNDKAYVTRLKILEGKALRETGRLDFAMGEIKSGQSYCDSALNIFQPLNENYEIAITDVLMGDILNDIGQYVQSLQKQYKALKIFTGLNDKKQMADIYSAMGITYFQLGNYEQATTYYLKCKNLAEEINDSRHLCWSTKGIGDLFLKQGYYTRAIELYEQSLALGTSGKFKHEIAFALNSLGNVYAAMKKYSEAEQKFRLALVIRETINDKYCTAQSLNDIGLIYMSQRVFDSTYFYFLRSLAIRTTMKIKKGMAECYNNIGKLFIEEKKYVQAKGWLNKSVALCEEPGFKSLKADCYQQLAIVYGFTNQFKTANEYNEKYISLKDSINTETTKSNLSAEIVRSEFEKKETAAKAEQERATADRKRRTGNLLMGAAILFIISLLIILLFRQRSLKRRAIEKANDIHTMAELEMQSLRAQLNPHFMFNSLNAIQELILMEENEKSHSYLARFSKLMRLMLENTEKLFIPLQREIDFLQLYLSLENLRIPELQFSITVDPEIDTEQTSIPNMILQPYIENAIWHGLSHKTSDKKLQVRITKTAGAIQYEIEDNGVGRKRSAEMKSLFRKEHKSKGMELLSRRFKLLSKELGADIVTNYEDVMSNGEVSGTLVTIKVPNNFSEGLK